MSTAILEGPEAFAKVAEHLKTMIDELKDDAGDTLSATTVALGHATMDLIGEVRTRLDDLGQEARKHPGRATAVATAAALVTAAAAALAAYALTRERA
ncbi:hypothetical protein SGCZBJ_01950 [Caulobacter zeae]|uniref:Uncharacterized protein n=2 Tax=Caulobacter zeae TaxID=2055137 RepID=A0A2N5DRG7_9CAUL|nr:hypothetical protein SGCZBJ_01950 [Caulobacter zeae]